MRTAIIYYWLVGMRVEVKVLQALGEIFPEADVFTHVYRSACAVPLPSRRPVPTTFLDSPPPLALEQLDLRDYDLVISSELGQAKGVMTGPDALHVCYCHAPTRYVRKMVHGAANPLVRTLIPWLAHRLRRRHVQTASRIDAVAANSALVAGQIRKFHRREAAVIHPPVATETFHPSADIEDFYLYVGPLVAYKRADLAIAAANALRRRLIIIGEGEHEAALRRMAGPTVTFVGRQPHDALRHYYASCRALIFPAEEDFGTIPVEAMASGRPVLALARGGALETIINGETGLLFEEQSVDGLIRAILEFETHGDRFRPARLVQHAGQFSRWAFRERFVEFVQRAAAPGDRDRDNLVSDGFPIVAAALANRRPPERLHA